MQASLIWIGIGLSIVGSAAGCGDAKRSEGAERDAKERRTRIQAEIKQLGDHPWAGEYYSGDGMGVNVTLVIAPNAGYVFEWYGCMGLFDRNFGTATEANNKIRLSFTFPNKREGFQGIAEEFIPVSWGPRRYLIPPGEMIGFCNRVNAGDEPRKGLYGFHLLRSGDEKKPVTGFPAVPAEFAKYLRTTPIASAIIAVRPSELRPSIADWKFKDTTVTVEGGKDVGLRGGMELYVVAPNDVVESVVIREVHETTCDGVMTQIGAEAPGPKVGWKLSTVPRWSSTSQGKRATAADRPGNP
jgi:hypothetical protein